MTHKYEDEQIAMEGVYPHTKAPQRTDMEVSRIEEMVEQLIEEADEMFWSDDDYTREDILKHILTKAHQAGIDEAVEKINGLFITSKKELDFVNPHIRTWEDGYNFALSEVKEALQDKK